MGRMVGTPIATDYTAKERNEKAESISNEHFNIRWIIKTGIANFMEANEKI